MLAGKGCTEGSATRETWVATETGQGRLRDTWEGTRFLNRALKSASLEEQ